MKQSIYRGLAVSALALALAACGGRSEAPAKPAAKAAQPAATTTAKPKAPAAGKRDKKPLDQGVVLAFRHEVRSDRVAKGADGKPRRVMVLEFLDGDAAKTMDSVRLAMATAGFTAGPLMDKKADTLKQAFTKQGYGRVVVWVLTRPGQKFKHAGARGSVKMDWPAPKATKPAAKPAAKPAEATPAPATT